MCNEVCDRVYFRYLFWCDKCGRCELNCCVSGIIVICIVGRVMWKWLGVLWCGFCWDVWW